MSRRGNIPFLPGSSFEAKTGSAHHKRQALTFANGVAVVMDNPEPTKALPSAAKKVDTEQPAWLAFDKQALSFDAYFKEAVHESPLENFRVRVCKIYFFPEDDTIEIVEPRQQDSGIPQGKLLRRHRVPKPAPESDDYYKVEDLNVGIEFPVYGRTFMITSCDAFTRDFLTRLGIAVNLDQEVPQDPFKTHKKKQKALAQPLRPYERQDNYKQFLDYDRKVLRFFCVWDDSKREHGDKLNMVLHYFLADDTIEVREQRKQNSGRDGPEVFLKRQKLPKDPSQHVRVPGTVTSRTLLNVFTQEGGLTGRYILDNLHTGSGESEFYTDKDLEIGVEISVFGRKMLIVDCDEFTKTYYTEKYGVEDFTPIATEEESAPARKATPPPYNGFGTEEDSLVSVNHLILKPPKKEFSRWFKEGNQSLQFQAKLDTQDDIDRDREFVIVYYTADDTLAIYENKIRNSGIGGGKFLERTKVKRSDGSGNVGPQDFVLGESVPIFGRKFVIQDASDFSLQYLEELQADGSVTAVVIESVRPKAVGAKDLLQDALAASANDDGDSVDFALFEKAIIENCDVGPQEARTLARACGIDGDYRKKGVSISEFFAKVASDST